MIKEEQDIISKYHFWRLLEVVGEKDTQTESKDCLGCGSCSSCGVGGCGSCSGGCSPSAVVLPT